jgi:ribosomal-protein-alanine N-acetyltransferase
MLPTSLILSEFPVLETARLRLREMTAADTAAVFRIFSDEEVTRYYDFDTFTSEQQAAELIARQRNRFDEGDAVRWGITQRQSDEVIGTVGLVLNSENGLGGLGYDLARPYWRHGLMSEALAVVIRFSFRTVKVNRLQALVMPGNVASAGLLEKLGFHDEGTLREYMYFKGRYQDLRCFSLLRREFEMGRGG